MKRTLTALGLIAVLTLAAPATANAGGYDPHPDVEYALAHEPGGIATSATTAEWPALGMQLIVLPELSRAVGTCATGMICAFSSSGLGGTQLSWSSCGSKSTAALGTVGSVANARSSGTLQARQGTTVRASTGANAYANVPLAYWSSITNVFC